MKSGDRVGDVIKALRWAQPDFWPCHCPNLKLEYDGAWKETGAVVIPIQFD